MRNELLLIASLLLLFGGVLLAFRFFGKTGLYCFSVLATVTANIEVLLLVDAFGLEQTLGNILFASTFLITDILSECYGKKEAQKAVWLGIAAVVFFLVISQLWLWYIPSENDQVASSFRVIFSQTPRTMLVSLAVYAVCQQLDVWLYHALWRLTQRRCGDSRRFLWLRNNAATLISQLANTVLFTLGCFVGVYPPQTLWSIIISSYVIFIVTSLADTPFLYLARRIHARRFAASPAPPQGDA